MTTLSHHPEKRNFIAVMKKALLLIICALPILFLATLYALLLRCDMMVWDHVALYMLIAAVITSLFVPVVFLVLGFILNKYFSLKLYFAASCLCSLVFWMVCYVDVGDTIHRFYAA